MAYLFDTDTISELLRPRPQIMYLNWINRIPREAQFTSAVVVGELYKGAYRSQNKDKHLNNISNRILPSLTVLPYDVAIAREVGRIRANLESKGQILPDADIQIAATAIYHQLELVTGNTRHFERIQDLKINPILTQSRQV